MTVVRKRLESKMYFQNLTNTLSRQCRLDDGTQIKCSLQNCSFLFSRVQSNVRFVCFVGFLKYNDRYQYLNGPFWSYNLYVFLTKIANCISKSSSWISPPWKVLLVHSIYKSLYGLPIVHIQYFWCQIDTSFSLKSEIRLRLDFSALAPVAYASVEPDNFAAFNDLKPFWFVKNLD